MTWKEWVGQRKLYVLIGLAGVSQHESKRARVWGRFFTYAMLLVAITLLFEWQLELLGELDTSNLLIVNRLVWLFFIIEFTALLFLVKDRPRFIRQNWLLPIIILLGLPLIVHSSVLGLVLRELRPLLAILIMIPTLGLLADFFIDGQLRTTLLAALIIVIVFGILVAGVDPNIKTAWDGIWWAIATVSTVGYGDVVPTSALGRLIGAGLVVLGLGVFVVITANFLALTLRKQAKEFKREEREVSEILNEIEAMKNIVDETLRRVKALEKKK